MTVTSNRLPALPGDIMVLGQRFRIDAVAAVEDGDAIGDMTGFYRRIRIDNTMTLARQWRVLGHEYIHACLHMTGIDSVLDGDMNEVITTVIEHGLEQLLRQVGPHLVSACTVDEEQ